MKTRLLKKLRKESIKNVRIVRTYDDIHLYAVIHLDNAGFIIRALHKRTFAECEYVLEKEKRHYIKKIAKQMRVQIENKKLDNGNII